jgi:phosphohistidine swiveling domain-containing protein
MDYFPLVQRFESALWVSMVCHGQAAERFERSLGWDFGVQNYRYRGHRHQIHIPYFERLGQLIASIPIDHRYDQFQSSCETACEEVLAAADRAAAGFKPGMDTAESFDLLSILLEASMDAMPFLPSLVLIQEELQQDLREAIASDLGVDQGSKEFGSFWQRVLVPVEQANFVPESRDVLAMAADYREQGIDPEADLESLAPPWRSRIDAHVREHGWIGTFTYLNEPFSAADILQRVQRAAKVSPHELEDTLERDRRSVVEADRALAELSSEQTRSLVSTARYFMYLRFERVDIHFKAEVRTRPIQHRLAELAGISRDALVMLTLDELRAWAVDGAPLPAEEELSLRVANGIEYEIVEGSHSWRAAKPIERILDPDARALARVGIEGSTACLGSARGRVKHVTSIAEMQGFEEGDVLLTPMTTPDVMYAIERAGAIVTEEGGVLCHAAIISRELNKPCLIGCRDATRAFADGDIVELLAEESGGSVTLLEEAA